LKLDALFFAAHPDDVELSCGGTVIKLSLSGKKTGIVDLTQGELSTRGNLKLRRIETNKANKILKIAKRINLAIPDGNIENTSANRIKIIKIIREYRPEIIFCPHFYDRHPDHFHAHELVKDAAFYAGLQKIKTSLNGKQQTAYRAKKNFYFMQTYEFEPSFIVDISSAFKSKMQAVLCYRSQFYNPSSKEPGTFISDPKFIKFLESRAQIYGFKAGVEFGEPFYTEEKIKISAPDLFNI
jgi:N-acetylglucosamine malate deacetylase 1